MITGIAMYRQAEWRKLLAINRRLDNMSAEHEGHGGHAGAHGTPGGLSVSAGGYTLKAEPTVFEAGREEAFGVRILDRAGREVRDLDVQHEELMHLIVVRRDLTHYQHLHPSLDEGGSWSVPLALPEPGVYRAFIDCSVNGEPLTLGVDLTAPGYLRVEPLPDPTDAVRIEDGYEVVLEGETPTAGTGSSVSFRIKRGGREIEDLEPYLGALGHLVALREGDLAYLHVHPTGGAGAQIEFHTEFPSEGRYRLFLQFAHAGVVCTAAFTVEIRP
jgi:hypothetical protein